MRWPVYLIVGASFALRLLDLPTDDLGMDGGWSLGLASLSRGEILAISARDVHPPLYYLLLHYWIVLAGKSVVAAKLPSLFFGVASVALSYPLARLVAGPRAGLLAALLLALSPTHVASAGLVRDFVAAVFSMQLSLYWFLRLRRGARSPIPYVGATLAALYTSYFAAVVVAVQVLWSLAGRWIAAGPGSGSVAGGQEKGKAGAPLVLFLPLLLGYLPWLLMVAVPAVEKVTLGLSPRAPTAAPVSPLLFAYGLWDLLIVGEYSPLRGTPYALLFFIVLLGGALYWRRARPQPPAMLALTVALGAAALLAIVVFWGAEGLTARYALLLVPLALPLLAYGLDSLGRAHSGLPVVLVLLLLASSSLGIAGYHSRPTLPEGFWDPRGLTRFLAENTQPEDGVIFITLEQAGYYMSQTAQPRRWYYFIVGAEYMRDNLAERIAQVLPQVARQHRRVWFVAYQNGLPGSAPLEYWLNENWYPAGGRWLKDSRVELYQTPRDDEVLLAARGDYGGRAALVAARLTATAHPGGTANLTLTWLAGAPLDKDYTVFAHLLDGQGKRWAQHDAQPQNGQKPTSRWTAGETIVDRHGIALPADMPPGRYTLVVGLYSGGQRLALTSGGNSLSLGEVVLDPL